MNRRLLAVSCVLAASSTLARADDGAGPGATDPPALVDEYNRAFTDFAAGRYATAAAEFDEVAAATVDPGRRTTATEMGQRARSMTEGSDAARPVVAPPVVTPATSHEGRYVFLAGTTFMGLGLYGWALPDALGVTDSKTYVGVYMLGAGASFFVPYMLTRDTRVTWGMTDAYWWGATRGAYHGLALEFLANGNQSTGRGTVATVGLTSVAEGIGAVLWAQHTNASPGLTNIMGKGGDFGSQLAIGIAVAAAPSSMTETAKYQLAGGAGLLGAAAGIYGGYALAQHRDFTWGDGEVIRTTGYLGAYIAALPLVLGESKDYRVDLSVLMGGAVIGLVAGDRLLDDKDFTPGQGVVTELSTIAGGLAGAGVGYLISPRSDTSAETKIIVTGSVLGAIGGFALAYLGLDTHVHHADGAPPAVSIHIAPQIGPDHKGLVIAGGF